MNNTETKIGKFEMRTLLAIADGTNRSCNGRWHMLLMRKGLTVRAPGTPAVYALTDAGRAVLA